MQRLAYTAVTVSNDEFAGIGLRHFFTDVLNKEVGFGGMYSRRNVPHTAGSSAKIVPCQHV